MLKQILTALDITSPEVLVRLEDHFKASLIVVAGDIKRIARQAKELRLAINTAECGLVLDHLAPQAPISIDQTEDAINTLFDDRFIEP